MLNSQNIDAILNSEVPGSYNAYLRRKPNPIHARYKHLSNDEFVAIRAYTANQGKYTYQLLNEQFRSLSISIEHYALYRKIRSGLSKIDRDRTPAIFYRYIRLTSAQLDEIYKSNFISLHTYLTSVSGNPKVAVPGNVFLRIIRSQNNQAPAYIGDISEYPKEEEYLYDQNTFFFVFSVKDLGLGNFEVQLVELDQ